MTATTTAENELLLRFVSGHKTAELVAGIVRVAFSDACSALDLTPGRGNFWSEATPNDLTVFASNADFRALPYADASFDVVVFDPPHLADGGKKSVMAQRYGTYPSNALEEVVREGCREAWRVARLGTLVKVTDALHQNRFVRMSGWIYDELGEPFEVVHQVRPPLIDFKWRKPQLSARNNGSRYLAHRKDGPIHRRHE
jgi:hypothetical protein